MLGLGLAAAACSADPAPAADAPRGGPAATPERTTPAVHAPTASAGRAGPLPSPRARPYVARVDLGVPGTAVGGSPHAPVRVVLHHTAGPSPTTRDGAVAAAASVVAGHQRRGWVDAAYHWAVAQDGTVVELRPESLAGDTSTAYDPTGALLVVALGDFETADPSPALLDGLADVLAARCHTLGVEPATLVGHRDLAATACPGARLQRHVPDLATRAAARRGEVVLAAGTG